MISVQNITIGNELSRISSAIFFLLCLIPALGTVIFGAVDETTWIIITVFWAAVILLWLGEAWKGGGLRLKASSLLLPLAILIFIGVVQLLPTPFASLNYAATRFFVGRLIVYFVFFAACLTFINNEQRLKKVVWFVVIFGSVMAFYGILQWLANPVGIYGLRGTPQAIPFGPFVNQHHFAAFMEMTGGVTLGLLFGGKRSRDRVMLLVLAVVIMGAAVGFTSSRGGLLGFVSVLAFVILMQLLTPKHRTDAADNVHLAAQRKIVVAASGLALIIIIFSVILFLGGNDQLLRGTGAIRDDVDVSTGRFHFWPIALKIFLGHPILGAGFDAFGVAFTKYDTWSGVLRVEQAHNEYLQTLADSGIIGLICVVAFIFLLFRKGIATILSQRGFRKSAAVGALAGCFGILVHSFFDFPLRTHSNTFFFFVLVAIATVPIVADTTQKRRRSSSEH
ncbi:MAG: O-antigen ligase family protein [Pyrinomonadaceae bacterium]